MAVLWQRDLRLLGRFGGIANRRSAFGEGFENGRGEGFGIGNGPEVAASRYAAQTGGGEQGGSEGGDRATGGSRDGGGEGGGQGGGGEIQGAPSGQDPRVPPDVGDGRDDDIVARQIREAAMKEEDPELREKLWDEYREYKRSAGGS